MIAGSQRPTTLQIAAAKLIRERSLERWGEKRPTVIIGQHPALADALERVVRFAGADGPVLITGETGTGKELFARAIYLLSRRNGTPFVCINCAQYQEGQIIASELFGHRKGSFTGALAEHRGVFEAGDGGIVFLDEVGELSLQTQAMLLRVLGEGEVVRVGETQSRKVDVRVVAATSRDLRALVEAGRFRSDLFYRLRGLQLRIPPVRERGDDWQLIVEYYLEQLGAARLRRKSFSRAALALLGNYAWPGNVREVKAVVDTGFHLSDGELIEAAHFAESLEEIARCGELARVPLLETPGRYEIMARGEASFWEVVHRPYLNRELSRAEARDIVAQGLGESRGSYKRLLTIFGIDAADYLRFMDFLRHHRLKPER
jgi:transcriptional regulator with GAF, ATPase, and Fis domain